MDLYFLDDESLIIDTGKSTNLIPVNYWLALIKSPIEAHDFLVEQHRSLDKNDLSSGTECKESMGAGVKTVE